MITTGKMEDDNGVLHWIEYEGRQVTVYIVSPQPKAKEVASILIDALVKTEVQRALDAQAYVPADMVLGAPVRLKLDEDAFMKMTTAPQPPKKKLFWQWPWRVEWVNPR